jgi:hypothetical protein
MLIRAEGKIRIRICTLASQFSVHARACISALEGSGRARRGERTRTILSLYNENYARAHNAQLSGGRKA